LSILKPKVTSSSLTANQSSRLAAYFAAGVAASMGSVTETEASSTIVYFPVDPAKVVGPEIGQSINFSSINLTNATYVFNQAYPYTAPSFRLTLEFGSNVWGFGGYGIDFAILGYDPVSGYDDFTALRFNFNDPISGSLSFGSQGLSRNHSKPPHKKIG